nr:DUF3795 domain-containing protein [Desulforamulus reducens]
MLDFCQSCKIKQCCSNKGLENCAVCNEQPCEKLIKFHNFLPDAKASFEALKKR